MPTLKQRRIAKEIIENAKVDNPKRAGEIVALSGYGPSMSKNPQVILNSDGVRQALEEQGFSEANAKKVVESIMLDEKVDANARLKATDQVFKIHGSYAPDKSTTLVVNTTLSIEEKDQLLQLFHE